MKLIGKFITRAAASASFRATTLNHEVWNHAMKNQVVEERFARLGSLCQGDKVLDGFRRFIGVQFGLEFSFFLTVTRKL